MYIIVLLFVLLPSLYLHCSNSSFFSFIHYLPYRSFHPRSIKKAFIKGEAIRFLRNSTCAKDFQASISRFTKQLKHRGYPSFFIKMGLAGVDFSMRSHYLMPKTGATKKREGVVLVLPYDYSRFLSLKGILGVCVDELKVKVNVVWKPPASLSKLLIRSKLPST